MKPLTIKRASCYSFFCTFLTMKKLKYSILLFIAFGCIAGRVNGQLKTENVILITLDGFRWQEVFTGANRLLVGNTEFVADSAKLVSRYWRSTPELRRTALLPFFWNTLASKGQIYGNRNYNNKVNVTNRMWFSYPGYNEILTGAADDARITSNDKIDNPNVTILEILNRDKRYAGKVAAFASWDVFDNIINSKRSGIPVSAGLQKQTKGPNEKEMLINELLYEIPNPLGDVRLDAFTFHYAFEYLKREKPRLLYIAFDETDDFAHQGKYDLYLEAAHYTDAMIEKLWKWLQSNSQYKDKTTLIITSDHGRGHSDMKSWRSHGINVTDADQIWLAAIGPDTTPLGEVNREGQLYQNQVAATIAHLMKITLENNKNAGSMIESIVNKK